MIFYFCFLKLHKTSWVGLG